VTVRAARRHRVLRRRGEGGQSSVELVALLPLLVVVALGVAQLLAAGVGRELAGHAAENGAIALADGEDATQAVRDALPGWAKSRVRVSVRGRQVRVRLTPVTVFPGAGEALRSEARADAGPSAGTDDTGSKEEGAAAAQAGAFGAAMQRGRDVPAGLGAGR
jgi:hypothetical protein